MTARDRAVGDVMPRQVTPRLKGEPKPKKQKLRPGLRARQSVAARSGGWCEVAVVGRCYGKAEYIHHRQRRSQGGTHHVDNLVHVCSACHAYIHDHVAISKLKGWLA